MAKLLFFSIFIVKQCMANDTFQKLDSIPQPVAELRGAEEDVGDGNVFSSFDPDKPGVIDTSHDDKGRIVGGTNVPIGTYPWFAMALDGNYWGGCGGMLVAPEYVLTAAHCIRSSPFSHFSIGALCYDNDNCGQNQESAKRVAQIIVHPLYDSFSMNNDFALVQLQTRSTATPVNMDKGSVADKYTGSNNKVWAIGFGNTRTDGGNGYPDRLKHVEVSFVPLKQCEEGYGSLTDNMICAADPGEDACQGDSGGPLYDKVNNALVGVTSFGAGCAQAEYPGVYAKVSAQWNWIQSTICNGHSNPKPDFCAASPPTPNPAPAPSPDGGGCVDDPIGWYDSGGEVYNCDWYKENSWCQYADEYPDINGVTANEACCTCGGGKISPTSPPVAAPSTAAPSLADGECIDSPLRFRAGKKFRNCKWVGGWRPDKRCAKRNVASHCPITCGSSCEEDSNRKFWLDPGVGNGKPKNCIWAGKNKTKRCKKKGIKETCRVTCSF